MLISSYQLRFAIILGLTNSNTNDTAQWQTVQLRTAMFA